MSVVREKYMSAAEVTGVVQPAAVRTRVNMRPLRAAMDRMGIPLRRIRENFKTQLQRTGGLYGHRFWRTVDRAQVGGFVGFITDPRGWEHIDPVPPEAVVFAFVRPVDHPLYRRLVVRKNSFFREVARKSASEQVRFDFYPDREEALVRHRSMRGRPDEILALSACDFLMASFRAFWASDFTGRVLALGNRKKRVA